MRSLWNDVSLNVTSAVSFPTTPRLYVLGPAGSGPVGTREGFIMANLRGLFFRIRILRLSQGRKYREDPNPSYVSSSLKHQFMDLKRVSNLNGYNSPTVGLK